MEVHHHPDLHHNRKKIREYLLEFIMIFLAVTLGFFAESFRENIADREKEKQYMESMVQDLTQDTLNIHQELIWEGQLILGLDSIRQIIYAGNFDDSAVNMLYALNPKYIRPLGIEFTDRTASQLKNAGGLRLIRQREITDRIASYWERIDLIKGQAGRADNNRALAWGLMNKLFNTQYYSDRDRLDRMTLKQHPVLLSKDPQLMAEYANHVFYLRCVILYFLRPTMQKQEVAAQNLLASIENGYDIK